MVSVGTSKVNKKMVARVERNCYFQKKAPKLLSVTVVICYVGLNQQKKLICECPSLGT